MSNTTDSKSYITTLYDARKCCYAPYILHTGLTNCLFVECCKTSLQFTVRRYNGKIFYFALRACRLFTTYREKTQLDLYDVQLRVV